MVGRRDALYRIVATTDWELGLESTGTAGGGEWASRDSLTITKWKEQEKARPESLVPRCKWGLIGLCLSKTEG